MAISRILQTLLSLKDKVLLSTGINSVGSGSTEYDELSLDNGFYAEAGVPVIGNFPPKRKRQLSLKRLLQGFMVVTALFAAKVGYGQVPVISYTGNPFTYTVGTPITTVTPNTTNGPILPRQTTTFVGGVPPTPAQGFANGTGNAATFYNPLGVAFDASGNMYVADAGNNAIRMVTAAGVVTTYANGANFSTPTGIAVDASGNVFVANAGANNVIKITAGTLVQGVFASTAVTGVTITTPSGIAIDGSGNLYVANTGRNNIVKIPAAGGTGAVFAGQTNGTGGTIINGTGTAARFNTPQGICIDPSFTNLYVADLNNNAIRKIVISSALVSSLAATGFTTPNGVAADASGNVYVSQSASGAHGVLLVNSSGTVSSLAAPGGAGFADGVSGTAAFGSGGGTTGGPNGIAMDASGTLFVADGTNDAIRRVSKYNISATLPAGLSFNYATGAISGTPTATQTATSYTITASSATTLSTGTNQLTITVNPGPPTTQATNVTFTNVAPTTSTISWTNGNGADRAVFILAGSSGSPSPVNGTVYTANTAFGSGSQAGTGWYCVFNGTGSTVNVTGLTANTSYQVMVVELNGPANPQYLTTTATGNPANVTTPLAAPTTQATNVAFTATTQTGTTINWTNGNGADRAVFILAGTTGSPSPVNGTTYTANTVFGSGTQIGATGWYCVFNGTGSTVNVTGLTANTTYRVMVVELNTPGNPQYLTTTATGNPANVTTVANTPTTQASNVTFTNTAPTSTTINWTPGNGQDRAVFIIAGTTGSPSPVNGTVYTANTAYGSGSQEGTGWFCVFNGTGSTVNVTGLTAATTYRVMVVELNGPANPQYLTTTNGTNPNNVTTPLPAPTMQATNITFTATTQTATTINWTNGNGTGRSVFVLAGATGSPSPVNGTTYTANTVFGSAGSQIGATGWYCVFNGTTGSTVSVTGLAANTSYQVMVVEWNTSGDPQYLTTTATGNPANVTTVANTPTTQASNVTFTNTAPTSTTINWTPGNGQDRAVFIIAGTTGSPSPVNGTVYTANTAYGSGSQEGTGWFCVFNGTGSTVNVTGLTAATTYRVMVVELNGPANPQYLTTTNGTNPNNVTTPLPAPTMQATNITFTATTQTATTINWTNGNGTGRSVFVLAGATGSPSPVNGTTYTANTVFGSAGSQIGATGWYCVFNGTTGSTVSVTGLAANTSYQVMVVEWNTSGDPQYLTATATGNPANVTTPVNPPTTQAHTVTFTGTTQTGTAINWVNGNGADRAVFIFAGTSGSPSPVNGTVYTANTAFGSGSQAGTGWYCVFNGTGSTVTVTGLSPATSYQVMVVELNGPANPQYLTTTATGNPANVTTLSNPPTTQASNITFTGTAATTTTINWTNGNGTGRDVFILAGTTGTPSPVNGTTYTANTAFGSAGSQIGATGWYCVFNGTGSGPVTVTGLSQTTSYQVMVVEWNGSGSPQYLTTTATGNPANVTTLAFQSQTITFNALSSQVYGAGPLTLTATASSGLTVSYISSNTAVATISGSTLTIVGAGSSTITASQAGNGTYAAATSVNQTLTVTPKALTGSIGTVTVVTKTYNQTNAATTTGTLSPTLNGVINGDNVSLSGRTNPTGTFSDANAAMGKTVTLTSPFLSGTNANNYTLTPITLLGTISQKGVTITGAAGVNKVYDGTTAATITGTVSGIISPDAVTLIGTGTFTAGASVGNGKAITAACTLGGAQGGNYTITTQPTVTANITRAPLAITANNVTKTYGQTLTGGSGSAAFTSMGLVNGETIGTVTIAYGTGSAANAPVSGSPYSSVSVTPLSFIGGTFTATNYSITYNAGNIIITPAALTVTANNQNINYGAAIPTLTIAYSGFVNSESPSNLPTQPTASTTATSTSQPGNYPITVGGGVSTNYAFNYVAGTLTIGAAPITFNPILSQVYGTPDFDPGATSLAPITYTSSNTAVAIIVSNKIHIIGVGTSTITATNGNDTQTQLLTVTPASLTIKADDASMTYGGTFPTLTATYTGLVNGDVAGSLTTAPTLSSTGTANSPAGSYTNSAAGAIDANYNISYATGTLTIGQATLTVTPDNQTKIYGAVNPALTISPIDYTGFVNGDGPGSLTTQPTAGTTATTASIVGTYPITASGGVSANYTFDYSVPGTLSVTQATLTVTPDNQTKIYGAVNPALTISPIDYTGFVNGDGPGSLTTQPTAGTTATTASIVGTYPITASGGVSANYTFDYSVPGTLSVTQATLTVTPDNQTKIYGAVNPALTISPIDYTGFVNGDGPGSLTTQPTAGTTATTASIVGTYPITASGGVSANYTFDYSVPGTLSVTQATLTVTPDNQTKIYGAVNPALTISPIDYTGFVNGDGPGSLTTQPTAGTTATTASIVGTYPITASGGVSANYTFDYSVPGTLSVTQATLTVTPDNQTKIYGAVNPALTISPIDYTGFVNGDGPGSLTTQPTAGTTATTASIVGTYPITASGGVSANYTFDYSVPGTLSVTQATLTVTPDNQTKIYGAVNPALTISPIDYTGFVNGDGPGSLTTQPTAGTTATTASIVGTYPITASGGVSANYTFDYSVPGTLSVTQATLTVTPDNQTKIYGAVNPALTISPIDYTGFVNGDGPGSLTTQPTAGTTATTASIVGTYPITASGGVSANYTFDYSVPGTLSVTQATLTVTPDNQTKIYGAVNPALTISPIDYTGFVNGDGPGSLTTQPTAGTTATTASIVGTYPITASGGVSANYTFDYSVPGTLSVTQATLTVTPDNQTKIYGAVNPALTISPIDYTGFVNGDGPGSLTTQPTAGTTATTASIVGTYPITASGGVSANYTFDYSVPGTLSVTQATLTVTPDNQTKIYGAVNPALTISPIDYTGFVNGDGPGSLTTQPTAGTTATTASIVGTYPITASGGVSANYTFDYSVPGTLSVTQATLTVTPDNQTKIYGAVNPALTISPIDYTGFVNGDGPGSLTTQPTAGTTATTASIVGTYPITASGGVSANYTFDYSVPGTLSVTQATLTVTPDNQTKIYGAVNPALTISPIDYTGFVNGDGPGSLTTQPTAGTTATTASIVGTYPITASGGVSANYTFDYSVPGTLSVTQATLTVTPDNQTKIYGAVNPALTISPIDYTGFVNGDGPGSLTTQPTAGTTATTASIVGTYPITASGGVSANYTFDYSVPGTLSVTQATLTVTPDNQTKIYGAVNPALTISPIDYTGFVNGDGPGSLTTQPTAGTTATTASIVGTYPITASGGVSANYTFDYSVPGTLSVTQATLTVTPDNQTKIYGAVNPALTISPIDYTGFVNGDGPGSLTTQPTAGTTATTASIVGTYPITASGGVSANYTFDYSVPGTLSVTQATLTVTPDNQTKIYGAVNPALTISPIDYTGFVNGDGPGSLTTQPTAGTTATTASIVGTYPITASGGVSANYTFDYSVPGTLSVTQATLTVTPDNQTKIYGAVNPALTISPIDYTGFVNGDGPGSLTTQPTAGTTATTASIVGTYPITASGGVSANYTFDYSVPGTLSVTQATLTVTPDNQTKIYGAVNPALTISPIDYTGFVNGDGPGSLTTQPTAGTTATTASIVGTYPITASGGVSANYTFDYSVPGTLSVTQATLTVTPDNQTKIYGAVNPALTISPIDYTGFVNGDGPGSLTTQPTAGTTATTASIVGTYPITASGGVSANYTFDYSVPGTLSVTQATLTVTPDNQTKIYGAVNPALTISPIDYTGFVNGDGPGSLTTQPTAGTTATTASIVGTYPITASGGVSANYTFDYSVPGTLSVTQATLTVTPDNQTKIYGAVNPALTISPIDYTGFVNGDGPGSLTTQPTAGTTATTASIVGTYPITASGGVSANYTFDYSVPGTLSVTQATLTVTPDNQTKIYGAVNPALTISPIDYTGFVNGDGPGSLTTQPTAGTTATTASIVGTYPITASGGVSANYTFDYSVPGTLSVTQATLTVTPDNQTKIYGAVNPALTISPIDYTGFVNGDGPGSLTTQPTAGTTATTASIVGTYPITASGGVSANYTFDYSVPGTLSVTQATLTVTPDNQTKIYGAVNPALTISPIDYTGFVNGDGPGSLTTQPTAGTTATTASIVGTYPITASGGVSANYTFDYSVPGTLSVTQATLTVTPDNQTKIYGAVNPALTISPIDYTGFVNGDGPGSLTTQPTAGTTATTASIVGTYPITASGGVSANYTFDYSVPGTLSVTQATLTVTPDNQTKIYGAVNPALTISPIDYTGFVNGDGPGSLTTQPTAGTTATTASIVGTYPITASGGVSANYTFDYSVPGTLSVTQATLTVTPDNQTKIYGAVNPALTISPIDYTGFVNGDGPGSLTTQPTAGTTATTASIVGTYPITASGGVSANYTFDYSVPGTLSVTQATLTVTANDATKAYGTTLAGVPVSANFMSTGLANSETIGSVTIAYGMGNLTTDGAGIYPGSVTASAATGGSFSPANYSINYLPGSLTVTNSTLLTITPDNQNRIYGASNPTLTYTITGFVNNDTEANSLTAGPTVTTANSSSPVGTYAIVASGASSPNYTITYNTGTLNINPASLTISAADASMTYGAAVPGLTANYSGFVNGDNANSLTTPPTLSTTATSTSPVTVAGYPITIGGAADNNYTIVYAPGTLTVNPAALTITANGVNKTYGSTLTGGSGSSAFTSSALQNSEAIGSVTIDYGSGAAATDPAGTYAGSVSPSGATGGSFDPNNYSINYVAGTLTVTPALLTITPDPVSRYYGYPNPSPLTVSYSGFQNIDDASSLTTPPTVTTTANVNSIPGTYPITASGAVSNNYTFKYQPGYLTVNTVPIVWAAIPAQVYGTPDFDPGASSFNNLAAVTYTSSNPLVATIVSGKIHIIAPGTSNITANNGSGTSIQTLTVTPAPLTITANNQVKNYGSANPALTLTYTGFVNGDDYTKLTAQPTVTTTATTNSQVSTYPITVSGAVDANYTITYTAGTLTVNPVALNIAANNQSKAYGSANPALTLTYTGFVNGDDFTKLTTQPTVTTTATTNSPVSTYPITVSGAVDANYTITYTPGTLTVNPVALNVAANNQSRAYGSSNPAFTLTYTGFVNGDDFTKLTTQPTVTTTATTNSPVGTYPITVSGAVDANYTITYTAGMLAVNPANLLITADNQSRTYGAANPTLTLTYTGLAAGDTPSSLSPQPTVSTTATTISPVGTYVITPTGAADPNYDITYMTGVLTVTPATLTITANNLTSTYGSALPTLTVSYSGFMNGDTRASLTTRPKITTTATATSPAGSYPITASGAVDPNYAFVYVPGTLTINPAVLTVTANNQSKTYGSANPALTVSYSGFVNGDTQVSLPIPATASTTATASSPAGSYLITPGGAVDPNYTFNYVQGTLIINPASLTIIANTAAKEYGASMPTLTVGYGGFVNGDTPVSLTAPPIISTAATASSPVGNYPINVSGAVDPNYNITYLPGTLIINPVALFITADDQTKVFGSPNPTFTASYSGFVNGDTPASLTTPPTITTTASTNSPVGTYPITASGAVDNNYTIAYSPGALTITGTSLTFAAIPAKTYGAADFDPGASSPSPITYTSGNHLVATIAGGNIHIVGVGTSVITATSGSSSIQQTLTVNPASLTITANVQTKTYGSPNPSLTFGYSGFVNGDNSSSLSTPPSISTAATISSAVGTYPITVSGAVDANYTITYVNANLTVTPVVLTITAADQTKTYGAALPALTVNYSGFVNGDDASKLSTPPTITTSATSASPVGSYPITASGAVDGNYNINYVSGNLTVTPATLTITANNLTKVYGAALPTLTASYSGFVNGDSKASLTTKPNITTIASTSSPVGPYPITVAGAADVNYTISYVAGTLTVTQAALTITADNQTKTYGSANPTLTASYTGFVNGDNSTNLATLPSINTIAATASPAGSYPITVTGAVDADYTISYVSGTLTVEQATLTITATTQSKTYGSPNPPLTVGYSGFVNGDNSASLTTPPSINTAAGTSSPVGNYTITASGAVDPNYAITYIPGTLIISPAALFITANDQTMTVGSVLPALTVSYNGFVNGDTPTQLTTSPIVTTTATSGSPVGSYPITASGAVDANYTIAYSPGVLTITGAALTFAPIPTQSYGNSDFDPGASGGSSIIYTSGNPAVATIVSNKIHIVGVGTSVITATVGSNSVQQTLTVTPAAVTITANNVNKTYGATLTGGAGSTAFTSTGLQNGQTIGSVTIAYGTGSAATVAVGTYTGSVTPSTATGGTFTAGNYNITYVSGNIVVGQAGLTITANNNNKTYGATLTGGAGSTAFTSTGLQNGQTIGSVTIAYGTGSAATVAVGTYTGSVTPSAATGGTFTAGNYNITYVSGNIVVGQAGLTITANNQSKAQGTANPTLTVTLTGLVGGDTQASLTTQPTVTTTATTSSPVGIYPITAKGAVDANYNITYVAGTLTVTSGTPLTFNAIPSKVYGTADFNPGATGGNGTITYTSATPAVATIVNGNIHIVGVGTSVIKATAGASSLTQLLTVTQAALTITANTQDKTYGATLTGGSGSAAFTSTGLQNGQTIGSVTIAYGTGSAATAAVGTYTGSVTPSAATGGTFTAGNYHITYVNGNIIVQQATLTIRANNISKTYGATVTGGSGSTAFTTTGLQNGQTIGSVTIAYGTGSAATAAAGTYAGSVTPSVAAGGTFTAGNYSIAYVSGNILVVKAGLTITATGLSKTYGTALTTHTSTTNFAAGGTISGQKVTGVTLTPNAAGLSATTAAGVAYTVTPSLATGTGGFLASNYAITYYSFTGTVVTAPLTITADNATKVYGTTQTLAKTAFTQVGLHNSDAVSGVTLTSAGTAPTAIVGTYSIVATAATGTGLTNYHIIYINGSDVVTPLATQTPLETAAVINEIPLQDRNPLMVVAYPNPSISTFSLQSKGGTGEKLEIRISDVLGHIIEQYTVMPGTTLTVGERMPRPGIYMVQIKQGQTYKFYKLFKQQ